jgi:phage baseplate assembly protein W
MTIAQVRSQSFTFDLNPYFDPLTSPRLTLVDKEAITGWLRLILTSSRNSGSRIFVSNLGSSLLDLLQDPVDDITAFKIKAGILSTISYADTRIKIDPSGVVVTPNPAYQGYNIRLSIVLAASTTSVVTSFLLTP